MPPKHGRGAAPRRLGVGAVTTYRITPATSVRTTTTLAHGFESGGPGADTLIVDANGFLRTEGPSAFGAKLAGTGAWTVQVQGSIVSEDSIGISLLPSGPAVSSITVGAVGKVGGSGLGIAAFGPVTVENQRVITENSGGGSGIYLAGAGTSTIVNTGTIDGAVSIGAAFGVGVELVTNSGVLNGGLLLGPGDDRLDNGGQINGKGAGDTLDLGDGADTLVNVGAIRLHVATAGGDDWVTNRGFIEGDVLLGAGADVFSNFTTAGGVAVGGVVTGTIDLGDGADHFVGGTNAETVRDGAGADDVRLGGGSDTYRAWGAGAGDGRDTIGGGDGLDTYDASGAANAVVVNLDAVAHDLSPFAPGPIRAAANTAAGADVAGASTDRITGFENALGGAAGDVIYGSAAGNHVDGGGGADFLFGFGGDDLLLGGASLDVLVGGAGRDTLTGGADADAFAFLAPGESRTSAAARDLITDFEDGVDSIWLDQIDAVRGTAANDAFAFIGTDVAFGGHAGELRATRTAAGQVVEGDVDGDGSADCSVALDDPGHAVVLTALDFVL